MLYIRIKENGRTKSRRMFSEFWKDVPQEELK